MIERIRVIGIGMGDVAHLTGEAVDAMRGTDVFAFPRKRDAVSDLVDARRALCEQVMGERPYAVVEIADPERGPDAERDAAAYRAAVDDWHAERIARYADALDRVGGGSVALLAWGDPALYDSTIRVASALAGHYGCEFDVIAGISAVSLLAARHRIVLNRIGQPVHITTGRRLLDEYDPALGDVIVMLDGHLAVAGLVDAHPDAWLFWGAYLGTAQEVLVAGRLRDVIDEVRAVRARAREEHGWVMDTYLIRPAQPARPER